MGGVIITNQNFAERANKVHENKYSYEKFDYVSREKDVVITCPIHGDFLQNAITHLRGHGCKRCHFDGTKTWTASDDRLLVENYAELGAPECAKRLGKTATAVRGRAKVLKITKPQKEWPYKILSVQRWDAIVSRAKKKGFEINITPSYVEMLFLSQNKRCALSNLALVMCQEPHLNTASVDRIDSSKGYIIGNIQIVHKDVNWMKNEFSDARFFEICHNVASFRRKDFIKRHIVWEDDILNDTIVPVYVDKCVEDSILKDEEPIFAENCKSCEG